MGESLTERRRVGESVRRRLCKSQVKSLLPR